MMNKFFIIYGENNFQSDNFIVKKNSYSNRHAFSIERFERRKFLAELIFFGFSIAKKFIRENEFYIFVIWVALY